MEAGARGAEGRRHSLTAVGPAMEEGGGVGNAVCPRRPRLLVPRRRRRGIKRSHGGRKADCGTDKQASDDHVAP